MGSEPERRDMGVERGSSEVERDGQDARGRSQLQASRIPRANRPQLPADQTSMHVGWADQPQSPSNLDGPLSPAAPDRVYPVRSVVSVDPTPTPSIRPDRGEGGYFGPAARGRRQSNATSDASSVIRTPAKPRQSSQDKTVQDAAERDRRESASSAGASTTGSPAPRQSSTYINDIVADAESVTSTRPGTASDMPPYSRAPSTMSGRSEELGGLVTARFKHVVTEGGHAVITGRDGETLQRCEDEPIHIPGAIQGFGLLIALEEEAEGKFVVRVVSENSKRMIGYTPKQLFALDNFTDILTEEQADNLLDHVDFIRDENADIVANGPEVFTMSIRTPQRRNTKLWCAMHINDSHTNYIICEFELEDDPVNPLVPSDGARTPDLPEDTLGSDPTEEELQESTLNSSKPLRVLRSARKRRGEAAAMEVFNIMSQVQEQLATAPTLEKFLKVLVGVIKELTGFHRVMVYQFDHAWNGRVVTELVDPRATKDLYKGLNFPASDIPKQARDMYKINKVRMLYDRDLNTARLVCRTVEDLENPLDLTHSYLRAMSPIHLKYLANMAVRSSMSISINAFDELWGLIACHSYGADGMRVSFPIRKMCRLVGDSASRNIERLSYASRLQARKLINTVPSASNPSGYIIASSEDLLKLFNADFGLLCIRDETKMLGHIEESQEALAMLEYLRMRNITNVTSSMDVRDDFPDLRYQPGFRIIAGLLLVPLSSAGQDFIVFFRKGQMREVKWAGNPYEKFIKEGTEGYLEPRKSFRTWSETVVGKCREWTEEEIETAAVLCLVYGKFIDVWRQKEATLQNSQLTRLLLANSAHEVRTPLNAIINYLEIALEGTLDTETRDNLSKSHSASKSLIYVINDLLDLTKTEEGGELIKDEVFDLKSTLAEATDPYKGDAKRKNIEYEVIKWPGLPHAVLGDQRRVRQAISNVTANAIQNTSQGGVEVDMYLVSGEECRCELEVTVTDTGAGMSAQKLDQLFRELEQVQSEAEATIEDAIAPSNKQRSESSKKGDRRTLGLGLAIVARIVRNMNGQLRLKSEEGKGSRFVIQFPFDLPDSEPKQLSLEESSATGSMMPDAIDHQSACPTTPGSSQHKDGEVTLIERGSTQGRHSQTRRDAPSMSRKTSGGSMNSRNSLGSVKSGHSNVSISSAHSGRSEADRLIDAISEPHMVEGWQEGSVARADSLKSSHSRGTTPSEGPSRPKLEKRHTLASHAGLGSPMKNRAKSIKVPRGVMGKSHEHPGQSLVMDQRTPLKAIRMHDAGSTSSGTEGSLRSLRSGSSKAGSASLKELAASSTVPEPPSAECMRALVAEDDPVNSRIIQKRLEKLSHEVVMTVNGEDCASVYCEKSGFFDIILMDMQVGLTAKGFGGR